MLEKLKLEKLKNREYWLSLSGVLAIYITGISNALRINNTGYGLAQINQFDSSIFAGNIAINMGEMSARFFMNYIISLGMKLFNGSWMIPAVIIIYIGAIVLALATVEIIFNLSDKHRILLAFILAIFLRYDVNNGLAGWGSFPIRTIGMGVAYSFVMLALSQIVGETKRWNVAWIMLSIATLCHVHEGMWGFCLFFILFICQSAREKRITFGKSQSCFIVFAVVLGICVIPGVFGPGSGISDKEFVQIYAYYRTAHHSVPSSWGFSTIAKYFCLIVASALLCMELLRIVGKIEEVKYLLLEATMAIASWVAIIALTYVFVEKIPSTAFVTMYATKYLRYVGVLSVIWCIKGVRDCLMSGKYLLAGLTTATVYLTSALTVKWVCLVYLLVVAAIILWEKYNPKNFETLFSIGFLTLTVALYFRGNIDKLNVMLCITFIALPYLAPLLEKGWASSLVNNAIVVVIFSLIVIGCSTKDRIWKVKDRAIQVVKAESYLEMCMGSDLYQLAHTFNETTETSEMFLTDPEVLMNCEFQFAAQRNSYTNKTNLPSSKPNIKEWYDRIIETRYLFSKNSDEIYKIMQDKNIDYVLVNSDNYEVFEDSDSFKIRNTSMDDKFRIYEAIY